VIEKLRGLRLTIADGLVGTIVEETPAYYTFLEERGRPSAPTIRLSRSFGLPESRLIKVYKRRCSLDVLASALANIPLLVNDMVQQSVKAKLIPGRAYEARMAGGIGALVWNPETLYRRSATVM
jgi:hypothetical protein